VSSPKGSGAEDGAQGTVQDVRKLVSLLAGELPALVSAKTASQYSVKARSGGSDAVVAAAEVPSGSCPTVTSTA